MAEEKLIQVNLQLPASELAGLTTFVEQLQSLLTLGTQHTAREQEVNTGFDETRFQSLEEATSAAAEIGTAYSGKTVTPEAMLSDISDPKQAPRLTFQPQRKHPLLQLQSGQRLPPTPLLLRWNKTSNPLLSLDILYRRAMKFPLHSMVTVKWRG